MSRLTTVRAIIRPITGTDTARRWVGVPFVSHPVPYTIVETAIFNVETHILMRYVILRVLSSTNWGILNGSAVDIRTKTQRNNVLKAFAVDKRGCRAVRWAGVPFVGCSLSTGHVCTFSKGHVGSRSYARGSAEAATTATGPATPHAPP